LGKEKKLRRKENPQRSGRLITSGVDAMQGVCPKGSFVKSAAGKKYEIVLGGRDGS